MEPIDASSRWNAWSVSGTPTQIDDVLNRLNRSLPPGWRSLTRSEILELGLNPFQSAFSPATPAWYSLDPASDHLGAIVTVNRIQPTQLRGGTVWFREGPDRPARPLEESDWAPLVSLVDHSIVPAAMAAGAIVKAPEPEEIFFGDLPLAVRSKLRGFSDFARKTLPLNDGEAEKWREFVVTTFRAGAVIDSRLFVNWLVREGWSRTTSEELDHLFFDQCLLLSRYSEQLQVV
ncbi:hypothetical protein [Aquisphaera insulae]|uniref:hypothetical protein n=1 Tax=Aquisphaera insulae TaxID=2712864 RepID=UPI0013EDCB32|nr:hypothetical protein [Aquisphaera insulae]